jgi:hypothetical protein
MLFEPTKAFEAIKERPNFIFPAIIMIIAVCISTYFTLPYQDEIKAYTYELMGISADHPMMQNQAQIPNSLTIALTMGGAIVLAIIGWLIMAVICRLFSMIFVGEGKYKHDLSVFANTYVFTLLGTLISCILLIVTKDPAKMNTNLSLFFPFLDHSGFMFWFTTNINIFTFIGLIFAVVGISIVENIKKYQAALMVFVPWLIGKAAAAAYYALFTIPMLQKMIG